VSCTLLLRLLCWNSGANATGDNWGSNGTFPIGLIGISRCVGGRTTIRAAMQKLAATHATMHIRDTRAQQPSFVRRCP
jgi:hypothetical protein